ncbi:hypothetical protein LINPERHAP2_LOCUS39133 [Linum perenne]
MKLHQPTAAVAPPTHRRRSSTNPSSLHQPTTNPSSLHQPTTTRRRRSTKPFRSTSQHQSTAQHHSDRHPLLLRSLDPPPFLRIESTTSSSEIDQWRFGGLVVLGRVRVRG